MGAARSLIMNKNEQKRKKYIHAMICHILQWACSNIVGNVIERDERQYLQHPQ